MTQWQLHTDPKQELKQILQGQREGEREGERGKEGTEERQKKREERKEKEGEGGLQIQVSYIYVDLLDCLINKYHTETVHYHNLVYTILV